MNKFVKSSLNISATLAIILAILSFVVPFLLWWFIIVGLGLLLWMSAIFGEKKTLWIVSVILCIVSLIISPTFWLYLSGLSLSPNIQAPKQVQFKNQDETKIAINDKTQLKAEKEPTKEELEARLNELWKIQTPITKKIFPFAIIKQDDGSYNYYPAVYQMWEKENIRKAFSQKWLDVSKVKVNIQDINSRIILETNAIELSKNPKRLQEFLDLYRNQKLTFFVDNNFVINTNYPVTFEILDKYRDVITEMNNYSGFSPQLDTKNNRTITFAIAQQADGSYAYYPAVSPRYDTGSMIKAFSQKGLDITKIIVDTGATDDRLTLETDAIKSSSNPEKLKEFLDLYNGKDLKKSMTNSNLISVIEYPITFDVLNTYTDTITEMARYSGFYPKLIIQ